MKNALIILIFLLSFLGLIIGVYYTEDIISDGSDDDVTEVIHEYDNGTIIISLEKEKNNDLTRFFT